MQLDISRQFSGPAAFVLRCTRRSDCIVAADVEVNFYLDKGQPTGRILVFAVGAGKAAVSIPYRAAKELLENKRDLPVVFGYSKALNDAPAGLIYDESQITKIRSGAHAWSTSTTPYPQAGCKCCRAWVHEFHLNADMTN